MTSPTTDRTSDRLDCWPVAGVATACVDHLKLPRTEGFPATADGQLHIGAAGNRRWRASIAPVTHVNWANDSSTSTGARLKTP